MSSRRQGYDPDALAALEDELDVQLRSLDDLEAEYAAGDLDTGDYETLRDDYTVRVADTMRRLDSQKVLAGDRRDRKINPLAIAAVVLFAAGAGWLLARSTTFSPARSPRLGSGSSTARNWRPTARSSPACSASTRYCSKIRTTPRP